MGRKRKHITEYEIVDELMKLEAEIFRVLKNTPKKYQFDLAQQTFDQLGYMKRLVGKALYFMPVASSDWRMKTSVLNEAFSEMGALQINLCQFVRLGAMSNETLARIDLQYNIVENNFLRLLAALAAKCGGLPLGNVTSQTAANFTTTLFVDKIRDEGIEFCIYTDDIPMVILEKRWGEWRKQIQPKIEEYIKEILHLEWHKDKIYVQHFSKGVEFLGYKLKFDRILPSDRVAHNFKLKTRRYIEQFDKSNHYNMSLVEDFMAMFNSYMWYLKWFNARKLEKEQINLLKSSNLGKCYNIYPNKIKIKKNKTRIFRIIQANKTREHNLLTKKSA